MAQDHADSSDQSTLLEQTKKRIFSGISNQLEMIGYVPQDLKQLVGDSDLANDEIGHLEDDIEQLKSESVEEPNQPGGALTERINSYYDEAFYSTGGIMGLLLGGTDFRNIGYWDAQTKDQNTAAENLQDQLLGMIPEKSGRILDVACGMGASTRRLKQFFPADQIWAINISEKQIESTRKNASGCYAEVMSAVDMTFEDDCFENIICIEAAFHFETRRKFFEESLRVLKSGGRLVLSDVLFTSSDRLAQHAVFPSPANHIQTVEEYHQLLHDVGFKNIAVNDVSNEVWGEHFRFVINKIHQELYAGRLDVIQVTEILWTYYYLNAITGVCLFASAEK